MSEFDKIAISGKICSGKTSVANMLVNEYGYTRFFFADELKKLCRDIAVYNKAVSLGVNVDTRQPLLKIICDDIQRITNSEEEYNKGIQQVMNIIDNYGDVTEYDPKSDNKTDRVRKMLQEVGTEYMRRNVNNDIWINALEKRVSSSPVDKIVVDDLRYENEFAMLRKRGFVMVRLSVSREVQEKRIMKLYGKLDDSKFMHPSEIALDHMIFDYTIDSDQNMDSMLNDIRLFLGGK